MRTSAPFLSPNRERAAPTPPPRKENGEGYIEERHEPQRFVAQRLPFRSRWSCPGFSSLTTANCA
eukprot:3688493-Prymnesium_polylepis.1